MTPPTGIFRITKRGLGLCIFGPLLLLTLNFVRDIRAIHSKYEWEMIDRTPLHKGVSTPGVMEAFHVVEIKSEVDETVDKKMVQEGQAVKAGQPLVQLTRQRTLLEYEQKKNSQANADADYRKAVRELKIQKKLLKNLAVSRQQVEDAEQAVEKTKAALQITSQELDLAQKKINSTMVVSPMNGVVLKDETKLGSSVSPGKVMITVGDVSKFIVRAKVDELDIQQIGVGQPVEIRADAFPGHTLKGVVTAIATQAEREAFAKIEVLIDITDADDLKLKHNLSVRVNIVTENIPASLSVPIKSILKKDGDVAWVTIKNKMGLVFRRRISIGKTAGDRVQVLSGISAGESVGSGRSIDRPL